MPIPYLGEIFRLHLAIPSCEFLGNYLTFGLPLVLGLSMQYRKAEAARRYLALYRELA